MIALQHICKYFGKKQIFEDFSLEIPDGSFIIITGESGCGKTTLLDMIGGLETPDTGEIVVDGKNINKIPRRIYFREEVGFLFQNFALMENKTVKQNLEIIKSKNRSAVSIEEALERVGLIHTLHTKVYQLSGGEQQRIALARLIIKKCNYILADEPTGSLDEKNGRLVMDQLHQLNKEGKCIIMVTHNRAFLPEADMVVEL